MCCMQQWNRKTDEGIGCAPAKLGQRSSVFCLFPVHVSCQWMFSKFYYGSVFIVIKIWNVGVSELQQGDIHVHCKEYVILTHETAIYISARGCTCSKRCHISITRDNPMGKVLLTSPIEPNCRGVFRCIFWGVDRKSKTTKLVESSM